VVKRGNKTKRGKHSSNKPSEGGVGGWWGKKSLWGREGGAERGPVQGRGDGGEWSRGAERGASLNPAPEEEEKSHSKSKLRTDTEKKKKKLFGKGKL